jgi:transcriptional regulator with GAF, ATPase, and Fis domain
MSQRDRRAWQAFVRLADTLVADFDVIDFLDTLAQVSTEVLGVSAAGILVTDHTGSLNLVAASSPQARMVELSELQNAEGPSLDAYRSGALVQCPDPGTAADRWPSFAPAVRAAGYAAVHALPMRLREEVIGALNLFSTQPGALDEETAELGRALADVATIGILHERTSRRHETVTEQLQNALNSRIVIEQAKGVLAERLRLPVEDAFAVLRDYARDRNLKLADVAHAVTAGDLHIPLPADTRDGRHELRKLPPAVGTSQITRRGRCDAPRTPRPGCRG